LLAVVAAHAWDIAWDVPTEWHWFNDFKNNDLIVFANSGEWGGLWIFNSIP
jgi:hypothetical protein